MTGVARCQQRGTVSLKRAQPVSILVPPSSPFRQPWEQPRSLGTLSHVHLHLYVAPPHSFQTVSGFSRTLLPQVRLIATVQCSPRFGCLAGPQLSSIASHIAELAPLMARPSTPSHSQGASMPRSCSSLIDRRFLRLQIILHEVRFV